jgi:hypothetical protein
VFLLYLGRALRFRAAALALAALVLAGALAWQLRQVTRAELPGLRAIHALGVAIVEALALGAA